LNEQKTIQQSKLEGRRKNYDFSYFAPEFMTSLIAVLRRCINKKNNAAAICLFYFFATLKSEKYL